MACHPSHRPKDMERGPGKRGVAFHHLWALGHDPNDPDAHPESGWIYYKVEQGSEPAPPPPPDLPGGPESGIPCQLCGAQLRVTRVVLNRHGERVALLRCPTNRCPNTGGPALLDLLPFRRR